MSDDIFSSPHPADPSARPPAAPAAAATTALAVRPMPGGADGSGAASTWGLGWTGVHTVALLELRQRIRSTRWVAVLVVWAALLAVLTLLVRWAVRRAYTAGFPADGGAEAERAVDLANQVAARMTFGIIVFLVLSLAGLVAPALSATSVNGDRQAGVLATLQTSLLTPAQIVVGKLLAAWVTGLALLGAALPFLLWIYLDGGTPFGRLVVVLAVMALTLLVVCAVGLGWSAAATRTSSSVVLTYITVALLGPGLPLLFLLSVPIVTETTLVPVLTQRAQPTADGSSPGACQVVQDRRPLTYTNRSWWLLAASPYVVVADASPKPVTTEGLGDDPLSSIRDNVREVRLGPQFPVQECYVGGADEEQRALARRAQRESLGVTWPYGLGADLTLGALFTVVAVRRLRTPTRRLPSGTRVA